MLEPESDTELDFISVTEACTKHYANNIDSDWAKFLEAQYLEHRFENPIFFMVTHALRESIDVYAKKPYVGKIEKISPDELELVSARMGRFSGKIKVRFDYGRGSRIWAKRRLRYFRVEPLIKKSDIDCCMKEAENSLSAYIRIIRKAFDVDIVTRAALVFIRLKNSRFYVGRLFFNDFTGTFAFAYNPRYKKQEFAIPLGPDLPLEKEIFRSENLFPSFKDRLPESINRAYPDYCEWEGISVEETNPIVLLTTVGRYSSSSFIFEPELTAL